MKMNYCILKVLKLMRAPMEMVLKAWASTFDGYQSPCESIP